MESVENPDNRTGDASANISPKRANITKGLTTNLNHTSLTGQGSSKKIAGADRNQVILPTAPDDKGTSRRVIMGNPKEQKRLMKEMQLKLTNLEK